MTNGQAVSVAELIDRGAWSTTQKVAAALAACAITMDGLDTQILSFAVPQIARDWHLTKSSFALVFATSLFAVAAGTMLGGYLGDKIGRRKAILLAVLWFGVFTLLLSTSGSLPALFLYRLISGIGIGAALPNAAAYIAEITPMRVRTTMITSTIVCIPFGGFIGGMIAAQVLPVASWRMLILISGVLQVLLAGILFMALPESPRFLAVRLSSGEQLLKLLRRFNLLVTPDITILREVEETLSGDKDTVGVLLSAPYRRNTLSLWAAFCFCLVSVYLAFNWLPSLLSNVGLGPAAASTGLATYNLAGMFGGVLLGMWMNHAGSRVPLLVAGIASIGTALWMALHLVATPKGSPLLTLQIGAHGFFVNAVQTALYSLAANLYPTQLRARGVAAASAIGRSGAILSAFVGGRALHYSGPVYFYILALAMTGAVISLQFLKHHLRGTREVSSEQRSGSN